MTDADAKKVGLNSARKGFLRHEVPSLGQAINMLAAGAEPSPSWQDIVDIDTMFMQGDVLHVSAAMVLSKAIDRLIIETTINDRPPG